MRLGVSGMYQFYTLSNGLRIGAEVMPQVKSVTAGFFIQAGGMTETAEQNGISHFVEHMLFKGTERRSACQLVQAIDRTGGTLNAFTSDEYTCVYVKTLDRQIETAVDVLCDMLFHSRLAAEDIALEKKVIGEEISLYEDSPEELVGDLLSSRTWGDCPAGRPILGTLESVNRLNREELAGYLERFYHPENMVFAIAGSFTLSHVISLLEKRMKEKFPPWLPSFPPCPMVFHSGISYQEKEAEQTQLALGLEGVSRMDPELYPLLAVNTVFGGSMSSRLFQKIREEKGLAYSIGSYPICHEASGLLVISAGVSPENTRQTVELMLQEIELLRQEGLSREEIESSKEQLAGGYLLGLESTSSRMSHLGKGMLLEGGVKTQEEILSLIDGITPEAAERVIQRVFTPDAFSLAAAGAVDEWIKAQGESWSE